MPALTAALIALVLTGCNLTITNLTPNTVPANPSQIYTITASFHANSQVEPSSIAPRIIIDGSAYPMTKSSAGSDLWEFDYQLPAGRDTARYYFICEYSGKGNTGGTTTELNSEMQTLRIAGRYVIRPEATRAPVGSRVSILGAGFATTDLVYFDQTPARTVFESPSSLSFFVPAVAPGRTYKLSIVNVGGSLDVGTFRVDAISFARRALPPLRRAAGPPLHHPQPRPCRRHAHRCPHRCARQRHHARGDGPRQRHQRHRARAGRPGRQRLALLHQQRRRKLRRGHGDGEVRRTVQVILRHRSVARALPRPARLNL